MECKIHSYDAIFRGQWAECQAYATQVASAAFPQRQSGSYQTEFSGTVGGRSFSGTSTTTQQDSIEQLYGVGPLTGALRGQQMADRQQLLNNAFTGCMAQKGWLLVTWQSPPPAAASEPKTVRETPSGPMMGNLGPGASCEAIECCISNVLL